MKMKTNDEYQKIFESLYIPQDDENVKQCKYPYPPYWFVSTKGRVYSVVSGKLEKLKAFCSNEKSKNKKVWSYKYTSQKDGKQKNVKLHRLMAEHFIFRSDKDNEKEVHHIERTINFDNDESESCNSIDNLQALPAKNHQELTRYVNRDDEKYRKKMIDKGKDNAIHLTLDPDSADILKERLQNVLNQMLSSDQSCIEPQDCDITAMVKDNHGFGKVLTLTQKNEEKTEEN